MTIRIARCTCGSVALELRGTPISTVVCYCDDCQAGSALLAALHNAAPVQDADGGTPYVLYRTDRAGYTRGADLLRHHKLKAGSATSRVVAGCCNAAMAVAFDDARHWVSVYRARLEDAPPVQMRVCTRFRIGGAPLPGDVPASASYPLRFMGQLLGAKIAMVLGR